MKTCVNCGVEGPASDFVKGRNRCKKCHSRICREYHRKNREAINARKRRWHEANRERNNAISREWHKANREYSLEKMRKWRLKNLEKHRADSKAWALANHERYLARLRKWKKENADKIREKAKEPRAMAQARDRAHRRRALVGPQSPELTQFIAAMLEEPCVYCGDGGKMTVDHIVPLSRGGKHEADNLAPACLPCNCSKGNKLLSEWGGRTS